jgi:hypothetical protein
VLGEEHPDTLTSLDNLAGSRFALGTPRGRGSFRNGWSRSSSGARNTGELSIWPGSETLTSLNNLDRDALSAEYWVTASRARTRICFSQRTSSQSSQKGAVRADWSTSIR